MNPINANIDGDIVVVKSPDSTRILRIDGYDVRVLVIVPRKLKEHDAVVRRLVETFDKGATEGPPATTPRLPIPERL